MLGNLHHGDLRASQSCLLIASECADLRGKIGEGTLSQSVTCLPGCLDPLLLFRATSVHSADVEKNDKRTGVACIHMLYHPFLSGPLGSSLTSDLLLAPLSLLEAGSQEPTHLSQDASAFGGSYKGICVSLYYSRFGKVP